METTKLRKFAQFARRSLIEQVASKLKLVLSDDSAARRENAEAIKSLEEQIKENGKEQVIEKVAYTWFNRFCALRFMDVNRYTAIGVVSPVVGQFQPEILAAAKMGHIDEEMVPEKTRQQVIALIREITPSSDPQLEAYRLLVVAACNYFNKVMPYLFERIADYTELLMPDDLLSGNSILAYTREAMTPDACQDVEVIGWLYQFYISEKKDEVFEGLKKNKKIIPENIPAATQLFTPHWIVRYLVENSLGRLWMLNRPASKLVEQMDYYIKPEQAETDFLHISKPEEIKICDPACGSGHMLTYAFDLLYAIYEEEGYETSEIPENILTHNLYGIEIDERAGELAAFALTMKARARQRRFFNKGVKPNICVLENIRFEAIKPADDLFTRQHSGEDELKAYMDFIGSDLFTAPLQTTLRQFEESDNFGSLISPDMTDVAGMLNMLQSKNVSGNLFLSPTHQKVLQALKQADYLSPKYHVVVANPPYMGGGNTNKRLNTWLKENYSDVKSDLFSAFVVRCANIGVNSSHCGIMSPNVWMSISSHKKLRNILIQQKTLSNLVELPLSGFKGATVQICAYNFINKYSPSMNGAFICLVGFKGGDDEMASLTREAINNPSCGWFYRASAADFNKIPGSPISYWVSNQVRKIFQTSTRLEELAPVKVGLQTGNNERFVREWFEVPISTASLCYIGSHDLSKKWFPYNKGGEFRKWYGNNENVVNWENDGYEIQHFIDEKGKLRSRPQNRNYYFRESISWSFISSSYFGVRYSDTKAVFDVAGSSAFPKEEDKYFLTGLLCSKLAPIFMKAMNPTMNFQVGNVASIPVSKNIRRIFIEEHCRHLVFIHKSDWNAFETSWDFTSLPLLQPEYRQPTLNGTYQKLRSHWQEMILEVQRLEQENNRFFIDAYGLEDELLPDVSLSEITLTCNPHYRYGGNKSNEELNALLLADTLRELISYAVGCMFGRYSLDKSGLILANHGETIEDYLKQIPEPTFVADKDNVIPMLDGDWFSDDISERFKLFLRVTFGEDHYEENLTFIENAIGKDVRKYFLKDFYADHIRRYKNRPIYWLFSSPKGGFNALIYIHRYRPDTISIVLNDYLCEFRNKLTYSKNHLEAISISASASAGEKSKALKDIEKVNKMIVEMEEYEREVYSRATEKVEIDLDDGVKANYAQFGAALKKIPGLDAKEEV